MQKKLHLLFALMMAFASSALAQVTTSGISGKVSADGEELIGARVEVTHKPSGTRYVAVTNAKGIYNIDGMRVGGPYEVKVTYIGFQPRTVSGITLQLGDTYRQDVKMNEDTKVLSDVVVTAKGSKFSYEKNGAVTNISNAQMVAMPTVSRSITDFTRLSPYGGNGMTFQGSDGRTANFTVDGGNFNNNFGLSSNLPGGGSPISIEAIEEMQVVISPIDVRQSGFIGGAVNAITKSGTNTFKGSAYIYHQNENMRGDYVYDEAVAGARDRDRKTTYGFTLGGPILKDKLFFFVNGEMAKAPNEAIVWRASKDGVASEVGKLSYTTVADMQSVSDFVSERFGYNTGSFTDFPADEHSEKLLARLDWNINDRNHAALRYNFTNSTSWMAPNASSMDGGTRSAFSRTSLYSMSFANSMYSLNNKVHNVSLDVNSRLTDQLTNQFLGTFSKLDDIRGTNSSEFPFIDIMDGTGNNTQYMALGYELFTYNNAVHNSIMNLKNDLTYTTGRHKITGGVAYEWQMADNQYMRNGTGYYRYKSVEDFLNQATPEVFCLTYGYGGEEKPAARVTFNKLSLYAMDDFKVNDRFMLNYGVRLDGIFFKNSELMTNQAVYDLDYNGRHIDTGKWPGGNVQVSPRIGFNWDVLGDKSLKVRGGSGLYQGRLPLVFFTNMPTNSGMVQYQAQIGPSLKDDKLPAAVQANGYGVNSILQSFNAANGGMLTSVSDMKDRLASMGFPTTISPEDGAVPSSISAVDPKFKLPQVWKTTLAVDYQLPVSFPLTVSAEGIFNKTVYDNSISDWSMMDAEGFARWQGVDNRPIFPSNFRTSTKAFVLENTHKGYGYSASLKVTARPWEFMNIMASYTKSGKKELTSLPGSAAESAFTYVPVVNGPNKIKLHNAINTEPDRFIANVNVNDRLGNHYSVIYESFRGGYNYTYMLANDMNGDGYSYDAMYIPTDKQVADGEFRFASADDQKRFMDFVHNDSYLSSHQGEYAEAYSVYSPWVHRVDIGYKHDFRVKAGKSMNTLQLGFDIKNVMNLFNNSWGVMKAMNSKLNSGRILKYENTDAEGYAVFSTPSAVSGNTKVWAPNYVIGQTWYMSIGLKYMFN